MEALCKLAAVPGSEAQIIAEVRARNGLYEDGTQTPDGTRGLREESGGPEQYEYRVGNSIHKVSRETCQQPRTAWTCERDPLLAWRSSFKAKGPEQGVGRHGHACVSQQLYA